MVAGASSSAGFRRPRPSPERVVHCWLLRADVMPIKQSQQAMIYDKSEEERRGDETKNVWGTKRICMYAYN